ncbi:hypothetical protein [Halocynthiibacter namhaensis]|uniref:hypothetical protein n=2 Tax=Halocynthiibacter namhaensis TaxID=1290553 RepID=UPI00069127F7|nr:hypothetical protein [Halocynthiibacter namhaensis]
MRFAFIDAWKEEWPVEFLCKVMRVTSRGFRAWRVRPMSQRQRDDMVILAHIREQHRLSLQSYGRPRIVLVGTFKGWLFPWEQKDERHADREKPRAFQIYNDLLLRTPDIP